MKKARLEVTFNILRKWLEEMTREEPLFIKKGGDLYFANFGFRPAEFHSNPYFYFSGIHQDKYQFELDHVDELNHISPPKFPEDEILGSLGVVEIEGDAIYLFYYLYNIDFEKQLDILLLQTPKSWHVEFLIDDENIRIPSSIELDASSYINLSENLTQKETQLSLRDIEIPNERKWDRFVIEHYLKRKTVTEICDLLKTQKLGNPNTQVIYNRLTQLRKLFPDLITYHSRYFKEKV